MSRPYPTMLRLQGRPCVVIGGGRVAIRKVSRLLEAGAAVRVIAPTLDEPLERLVKSGAIKVERRPYRRGDLAGALLAFAATDSRTVNTAVSDEADERGILVNVADDPQASSFHVPATLERQGISIAISTGGRSPAFARRLREELDDVLSDDRLALLELYAELRAELTSQQIPTSGVSWTRADHQALELLRQGRRAEARQVLREQALADVRRRS